MGDMIDLGWGEIPAERVGYMVRTCRREGGLLVSPSSLAAGFAWPAEVGAVVEAPDWRPTVACGGGLHGLRAGQQDPGEWVTGPHPVWMVVAFDVAESVDLGGKTKVRRCRVELVIDEADGAAAVVPLWLRARGVVDPVYRGTATAGDDGTAAAGAWGTATAGAWGTATAGDWGTATAGDGGTATAGDDGTAAAGYEGTATAGAWGIATAGDRGTATAGDDGTAAAGAWGTATAGDGGTATAGDWGTIVVAYLAAGRRRLHVGYIGEGGLIAGVPYRVEVVDGAPRWVRAGVSHG